MSPLLAYAEQADTSSTNLLMVLGCIFIVAATALLGFVIILLSRRRRHPARELIGVLIFFWGLLAAGSLLYALISQTNYSKEYTRQLQTGYLDPRNTSQAPALPWIVWGALGVVYIALLFWTLRTTNARDSNQTQEN